MIVTELYNGQGLGNQLFAYVMTRVIARDHGYEFGIAHPEKFKGSSFLTLDFGQSVDSGTVPYEGGEPTTLPDGIVHYFREERLNHANGSDIRGYDEEAKNIQDNTKIDGYFQGEDYFLHRKDEIREWLKISEISLPENLCIVNFRGGEYVGGNDLFLDISYWKDAIEYMKSRVEGVQFKIVTDDIKTAKKFFPEYEVTHDMAIDYICIQYAHYLILSNSSFALLPAWLNQNAKLVVAPKYWARHNISDGYWSLSYNIVKGWLYLDTKGNISDYESCIRERDEYMNKNRDTFWVGEPAIKTYSYKEKVTIFIGKLLPQGVKIFVKNILKKNDLS